MLDITIAIKDDMYDFIKSTVSNNNLILRDRVYMLCTTDKNKESSKWYDKFGEENLYFISYIFLLFSNISRIKYMLKTYTYIDHNNKEYFDHLCNIY